LKEAAVLGGELNAVPGGDAIGDIDVEAMVETAAPDARSRSVTIFYDPAPVLP